MNPLVVVGSVGVFLLVGSATMSVGRWLTAVLGRVARWWLMAAGLLVAAGGSWFVVSRGGSRELLVLAALVAGGAVFAGLARGFLGPRAVMLVATGMVAEAGGVAAWVLWYGGAFQPWARPVAAGLGVAVAVYLAVVVLAAVGVAVDTLRWLFRELLGRLRPEGR